MDVANFLREKARRIKKTIILPEKEDKRILKAARIIQQEKIANIILLGKQDLKREKIEEYSKLYFELRKHKGITQSEAKESLSNPLYYTCFMIKEGLADGFVAGASHTTPDVARAAIRCLGVDSQFGVVSSAFIMQVPNCAYGEEGVFLFADCGIVPEPTSEQLAKIALCTANLAKEVLGFTPLEIERSSKNDLSLTGFKPRIAMLSFSTKGSSDNPLIKKVREATQILKASISDAIVEGEIQADAAIVPEVALIKNPESELKGRANILIFPDLEAGNISYKLVQRLANARAIGPILQGLNFPCSDLSRGCSIEDIVDVVALTAVRANK